MSQILHIDRALSAVLSEYGTAFYFILFAVIFVETGLVVMPFLPGDSLLFAAGSLASLPASHLSLPLVYLVIFAGALAGDNVNYLLGKTLGPKLFHGEGGRFFQRKHLDKTHAYFEKFGGKTIIIARFVPIVRTFTPFVAGLGAMTYLRFLAYSLVGAALWVGSCVTLGYKFGQIKQVKDNFTVVVLAIIFISIIPAIIEVWKHRNSARESIKG